MSLLEELHISSFFDTTKEFVYPERSSFEKDIFSVAKWSPEPTAYKTYSSPIERPNRQNSSSYNPFYQSSKPVYNMFSNTQISFPTQFSAAKTYLDQQSIIESFPHLEGMNDHGFDISKVSENAQFFILRSSNDDNIHKAIKYNLWSTTTAGKATLSAAWKEAEDKGIVPEIYLIFSVVNSNNILGVAKMASNIQDEETFMYWWEPVKWFGSFQLKWVYIKDVPSGMFEHIKEEQFGTYSFINLKDSTKLSPESGREILKIFKDYTPRSNIFESFSYMDQREDYIRLQRDNNAYFLKYFEDCCNAYQKDPEGFTPKKKTQYNSKGRKNSTGTTDSNNSADKKPTNNQHRKPHNNNKKANSENNAGNSNKSNNNKGQNNKKKDVRVSLVEQFGIKTTASKKNKDKKHKKMVKGEEKTNTLGNTASKGN